MIKRENVFILILLCELYLPSYKLNFFIQTTTLLVLFFLGKKTISRRFFKVILPIIFIFLLGFLGCFFNNYIFSDFFKDVTYFLKPIVNLTLSYLLIKNNKNLISFLRIITYFALFSALIHLFGVFIIGDFSNNIHKIRGDFGLDNFIEIFAFFVLLFSNKFLKESLYKYRFSFYLMLSLLLISILLYFSRTMFVMFFLVGITILGYSKITLKSLKIISVFTLVLSLFYLYLFSIKINRNSDGVEALMYKIKIAPEEIFKTKIDRENHKDLWDHWRGYEVKRAIKLMNENPSSYFIGTGFGSLVNLKFKAPVSENGMKFISRLHNGYIFTLYKTGVFGLFFLCVFLFNLYKRIYSIRNSDNSEGVFIKKLISAIGLFYLFSTLIITGIYIPNDTLIFILGGLLFYNENNKIIT